MYRSALRSTSPVEKFMHLYNILLMLYGDKQAALDAFIVNEEPGVAQTPNPRFLHKNPQPMETVYTRLRNELGHKRQNVNLDMTKTEMEAHVGGLAAFVKRAMSCTRSSTGSLGSKEEIRSRFVFSGKNDAPTPDF